MTNQTHGKSGRICCGCLIGVLLLVNGCQIKPVAQALAPEMTGSDPEAQMEFWHTLVDRKITSNDEAFHGLLLFLDQEDPSADYEARVALLKQRQMIAEDFDQPATAAIQRGTLAVALVRFLQIKGGVTMRMLGPTPRYATRELQYLSLYPASSPQQTFSGAEFVGIIGRAEDYERKFAFRKPAGELPDGEETGEGRVAERAKLEAATAR